MAAEILTVTSSLGFLRSIRRYRVVNGAAVVVRADIQHDAMPGQPLHINVRVRSDSIQTLVDLDARPLFVTREVLNRENSTYTPFPGALNISHVIV